MKNIRLLMASVLFASLVMIGSASAQSDADFARKLTEGMGAMVKKAKEPATVQGTPVRPVAKSVSSGDGVICDCYAGGLWYVYLGNVAGDTKQDAFRECRRVSKKRGFDDNCNIIVNNCQ